MRLELTGRHIDITPALRRLVETKLVRLERLLNDRALSAQAVLTREKNGFRADISLHARGDNFLHGHASSDGWGPSEKSWGGPRASAMRSATESPTNWA